MKLTQHEQMTTQWRPFHTVPTGHPCRHAGPAELEVKIWSKVTAENLAADAAEFDALFHFSPNHSRPSKEDTVGMHLHSLALQPQKQTDLPITHFNPLQL